MLKKLFKVYAVSICTLTITLAQEQAETPYTQGSPSAASESQPPAQYPVIDTADFEAKRKQHRAAFQQTWNRQTEREQRERAAKAERFTKYFN